MSEEMKMKDTSAESATTIEGVKDLSATPVVDDLNERVAAFNIDLNPLLAKHELKLGAEPRIVQGLITAIPVVTNARVVPEENKVPQSDTPVA